MNNKNKIQNAEKYHLRFFLTPLCNFKCIYCNDGKYVNNDLITFDEIKKLIKSASQLGINKIHYTGGEPSLRNELEDIVLYAKECGFIQQVMTTNGSISISRLETLKQNGLTRINISIDSLDPEKHQEITRSKQYDKVICTINKSIELFNTVKLNIVMLKENVDEYVNFMNFAEQFNGKVIPKFIELVENNPVFYNNKDTLNSKRVNRNDFFNTVKSLGDMDVVDVEKKNPNSEYFKFKNRNITFGLVTSHTNKYACGDCRKIRISPYGEIGYCINFDKISLKKETNYENLIINVVNKREKLDELMPNRKHISYSYGHWRFGDLDK